ncbi:DUF5642 family protein [Mycobacteroides sp. LB1]|uniref:DUF5642 family protein n=1 Tax=Mycobacteroides sp. LB1 TaxID=2750814 RepID=UPI0021023BDC
MERGRGFVARRLTVPNRFAYLLSTVALLATSCGGTDEPAGLDIDVVRNLTSEVPSGYKVEMFDSWSPNAGSGASNQDYSQVFPERCESVLRARVTRAGEKDIVRGFNALSPDGDTLLSVQAVKTDKPLDFEDIPQECRSVTFSTASAHGLASVTEKPNVRAEYVQAIRSSTIDANSESGEGTNQYDYFAKVKGQILLHVIISKPITLDDSLDPALGRQLFVKGAELLQGI